MNVKRGTEAREYDRTPLLGPLSDSAVRIYATLSAPSILPHPKPESTRCPAILRLCLSSCLSLSFAIPPPPPRFFMSLWQWADTLNIIERRITPRRFSSRSLIKKCRGYLRLSNGSSHPIEIPFVRILLIETDFSNSLGIRESWIKVEKKWNKKIDGIQQKPWSWICSVILHAFSRHAFINFYFSKFHLIYRVYIYSYLIFSTY